MGLIRFSLAGREGLVVPDKGWLANRRLTQLGGLMLRHGAEATVLVPGMLEDITPPAFTRNRYQYLLTTPPEAPAEKATVHLLLKDDSREAYIAGRRDIPESAERQITIPDDSVAFPLMRPTLDVPPKMEIHELIFTTMHVDPQAVIESVRS